MTKLTIDSSVFISSLGVHDEYTSDSRKFFEKCNDYEILVPTLVVAEVMTVLSKQGLKNAANLLKYFSSLSLVSLDYGFLKYFASHLTPSPTLKSSDLIVALSASQSNAILITWDKKLLSTGRKLCQVKTPVAYLE